MSRRADCWRCAAQGPLDSAGLCVANCSPGEESIARRNAGEAQRLTAERGAGIARAEKAEAEREALLEAASEARHELLAAGRGGRDVYAAADDAIQCLGAAIAKARRGGA